MLRIKPGCMLSIILFLLAAAFVRVADINDLIPSAPANTGLGSSLPKPGSTSQAVQSVLISPSPQDTPTPAPTPTQAIDYQGLLIAAESTSQSAAATSQAAMVALVQITAANEALHAAETMSANDKAIAEANAQAVAIHASETAQVLSYPATASQQVISNTQTPAAMAFISGQWTQVKEYPTQILAAADSNNSAESWWIDFAIRMFVFISMGIFLLGVGSFLLRKPAILAAQSAQADDQIEQEERQREDLQFEREEDSEGESFVRIDPNIPAPLPELLMLASGILDRDLSLVFRDWGKTPVYQYLKDLRLFLKRNRMADSIPGGELIINKKGREFLRDSRASGTPPPPYRVAL